MNNSSQLQHLQIRTMKNDCMHYLAKNSLSCKKSNFEDYQKYISLYLTAWLNLRESRNSIKLTTQNNRNTTKPHS